MQTAVWQIANLFDKYDEDRSGELDISEMCKLMLESDVSPMPRNAVNIDILSNGSRGFSG